MIAKNRIYLKDESSFVKSLCEKLTIEKNYCKTALGQLQSDDFVIETPPRFNNTGIAEAFIRDAIKIGFADKNLHLFELNWLKFVAEANSLDKNWCILELQTHLNDTSEQTLNPEDLDINQLLNEDNGEP